MESKASRLIRHIVSDSFVLIASANLTWVVLPPSGRKGCRRYDPGGDPDGWISLVLMVSVLTSAWVASLR